MVWLKPPIQAVSDWSWRSCSTHIPSADKHRDHVRFAQLGVSGPHQLEQLAEGIAFLKDTTAAWCAIRQEAAGIRRQGSLHLPLCSQTSSPMVGCGCCPPPCALWQGCSGTSQSGELKRNKRAGWSLVMALLLSKPRHWQTNCVVILRSCETFSVPKDPALLSKSNTPASTFTDTVCLPDLTIFTWECERTQQFTSSENSRWIWFKKSILQPLTSTGLPGMSEQAAAWCCSWNLHWNVSVQAPVDSTELPGYGWSLHPVTLSAPSQRSDYSNKRQYQDQFRFR